MSKSDWEYFNCSEQYEVNYVVSLYPAKDKAQVRSFIEQGCKTKIIKNMTHAELYKLLATKGFHRE